MPCLKHSLFFFALVQKTVSCLGTCLLVFLFLSSIISIALGDQGCDPIISTLTGNYDPCNPDWAPQWNPENPQTIKPFDNEDETSGVAKISFIGGRLPYTWEISGNGFWLDDQYTQTTTVTNTYSTLIYADEDACGSALITVTDDCGATGEGSIRSTKGKWTGWIEVDSISSYDICEGTGATYKVNRTACEDVFNMYSWYAKVWPNGKSLGVPQPWCNQGVDCSGAGGACVLTVSDGICSYELDAAKSHLGSKAGFALMQLFRSEWVCE